MTFLWPRPTLGELGEIYSEEYYLSWGIAGEDEALPRSMKQRTFAAQLDTLAECLPVGKVLDVGCATGFFLEVARERGWDVYGVELSSYAAEMARKKFGDHIFNGALENAGLADGEFDLVALSDLLEHVVDPLAFLREVHRILKPGGMVMVVTPDVGCLSEYLMKGKWSHYKREHLYYFSTATIRKCLAATGYTTIRIEPAIKYLSLAYIITQFIVYPHPLLTPLLKVVNRILPQWLKGLVFPLRCGEMMAIASKDADLELQKGHHVNG